jgi:hypothetical protein
LGGTINFSGTGEQLLTSGRLFADTSAVYPEDWDLNLQSNIIGVPISGFTKDFAGNNLSNPPSVGMLQYAPPVPPTPTPTQKLYIRKRFVNKP